jgi:EAL domain-containing protein (putative c-di-GMP-specific phosphodiesterase class I)/GGDEF domain-containing protein
MSSFTRNLSTTLRKKSLLALTLISTCFLLALTVVYVGVQEQKQFARLINVSGRQRMLSQQSAFLTALLMQSDQSSLKRALFLRQQKTLQLLYKSHQWLRIQNRGLSSDLWRTKLNALFAKERGPLNTQLLKYRQWLTKLATSPKTRFSPALKRQLFDNSRELLGTLNQAVLLYESKSRKNIRRLFLLLGLIATIFLLLLFSVRRVVLLPLISKLTENENQLIKAAYFDSETTLPNTRWLLKTFAENLQKQEEQPEEQFAFFMLSYEELQKTIGSMGHDFYHRILAEIQLRLQRACGSETEIALLGDSRFGVLVQDVKGEAEAIERAQKLLQELEPSFALEGLEIRLKACLGIVVPDSSETPPKSILQHAHTALQQAISNPSRQWCFFGSELQERSRRNLLLETDLHRGLEGEAIGLSLYFQPIVGLDGIALVGCEALTRWHHPELGFVSPAEFVPLAERSTLVVLLDRWVLRQACEQLERWKQHNSTAELFISVNISGTTFQRPDFIAFFDTLLASYNIDPGLLHLEMTEGVLIKNLSDVKNKLTVLRQRGFHILLDDFGTGYSSLHYLFELPIDILKLDRSFVQQMLQNRSARIMMSKITELARLLQLRVVAEGVEEKSQLTELRKLHCDFVQGFYFSRPLPLLEFQRFALQSKKRGRWSTTAPILPGEEEILQELTRRLS